MQHPKYLCLKSWFSTILMNLKMLYQKHCETKMVAFIRNFYVRTNSAAQLALL